MPHTPDHGILYAMLLTKNKAAFKTNAVLNSSLPLLTRPGVCFSYTSFNKALEPPTTSKKVKSNLLFSTFTNKNSPPRIPTQREDSGWSVCNCAYAEQEVDFKNQSLH